MSRGPDLARQAVWRRRLREFERSTASVVEFCERAGVSVAAFYQWRRKLAPRAASEVRPAAPARADSARATRPAANRVPATPSPAAGPAMSFLPVEIAAATRLQVRLPNGTRVSIPCHDPEVIRIVLAAFLTAGAANVPREDRGC